MALPRIIIEKDGEGYFAKIEWIDNIFAYGYTVEEAFEELKNVIEMFVEEII